MSTPVSSRSLPILLPGASVDLRTFDDFPAMIWVADTAQHVIYQNEAASNFSGLTLEQTKEGWLLKVHPDDRETVFETARRSRATRTASVCEVRYERAGGDYCWIA